MDNNTRLELVLIKVKALCEDFDLDAGVHSEITDLVRDSYRAALDDYHENLSNSYKSKDTKT